MRDTQIYQHIMKHRESGKSDKYIAKKLGLKSPASVPAYLRWARMKKQIGTSYQISGNFKDYAATEHIVIPLEAVEKLDSRQTSRFLDILSTLFDEEETEQSQQHRTQKGLETSLKSLPESRAREIVIGLKAKGVPNERIYADRRLRRYGKPVIRAYISHCKEGMSYPSRKLI